MTDDWRTPFENALDTDPSNQAVRRDLADKLDEWGEPDGDAVRWLADNGVSPGWADSRPTPGSGTWYWYVAGEGAFWNHLGHCLSRPLFSALPAVVKDQSSWWHGYKDRHAAEAEFCTAFKLARESGWQP